MQRFFISAPAGVKLSKIKSLLSEEGFEAVQPAEIPSLGTSVLEKVNEAIREADLFIAIFDQSLSNKNTLFELGLAYAYQKQVLILVPPGVRIPSDISGLLYINSGVDNVDAIRFAIEQLLTAPKPKKRQKKSSFVTQKPLGSKAITLLKKLDDFGEDITERDLELIVTELLQESGISVITPSKQKDKRVDLAIWVDELESVLGNPILVEVKKKVTSKTQVDRISNQILEYLQKTNSRYALLVYHVGFPTNKIQNSIGSFNILCFQLRDLIQQLQFQSFGDIVRDTRNGIIHGGE